MKIFNQLIAASALALSIMACGGGGGSDDGGNNNPTFYSVSTNAGTGGSISPTSASVESGKITSFTVTADNGYSIDSVSGCDGSLSGNSYTTAAITANCTVSASFSQNNQAPTANAGADQTVDEQTEVTLFGSGTDSDGSVASYSWTQTAGTTVSLNNADSATATFTAPDISANETLTFTLTVTDNDGATAEDDVTVNVLNLVATANAGEDLTVNKYTPVSLNATLSSNTTTYLWTQTEGPEITLSDSSSATPSFTPISSANYRFTLKTSNEDSSTTDEVLITAQDISTVLITLPTSADTISVSSAQISLTGEAGEHILSLSVSNSANNSTVQGTLNGDGTFIVEEISLIEGDNLVVVTGVDNTGASSVDSLLITYNQSVNFLSSPSFSEDAAFINEQLSIVVSVAIEDSQAIVTDGVKLVELTETGTPLPESVAILYDDGNVANGDDIAGDNLFSAKFDLLKDTSSTVAYRVSVDTGSAAYSSPIYIDILTPLTDEDIQAANDNVESAFTDNFPEQGASFTRPQFDEYKDAILAELLTQTNVVSANLSADRNSITAEFDTGLIHTIDFVYSGSKSGGTRTSNQLKQNSLKTPQPTINYYPSIPTDHQAKGAELNYKRTAGEVGSIGSYRTLALSPFKWQFDPYDDIDGAYVAIQNSSTPTFTAEAPIIDYDVTVEHFKNLSQYGVVVISSHGGLEGNNPVIYTGEEATADKQKDYQKDIDTGRLMISKTVILVEDGGLFWFDSQESKKVFKVAPSFINKYNSDMPNTLVYMSICQGMATDALANAFINAGAGAFLGYTDIVNASYAFNSGKTFFESMVSGKTVEESIKDATDAHGVDDGDTTPAAFVFRGNGDLVLERVGIENGGFEENLKYWEKNGGDVRSLTKLASLTPQEGTKMAIISSGLGSVVDSDATISQQFKVPASATTLSFDYDVISEEPMEWVGSSFDDQFRVVLINENGTEIELAYESVNTSTWFEIAGDQEGGGMFDGGDHTAYHTDWKSISFDISQHAGQTVTLKMRVWDVGDSIYDTAALLDNIVLQ